MYVLGMFMAFRQANLSFTGTCNTDEKKKQQQQQQNGTKFADFHTAKEEYIVSPMQVKRQQAPTFAFCRSFFSLLFSFILQSIYHLGNCEIGNHFFTLAVVLQALFITGFEIGTPLIISENKRSKVSTWLGLSMPGFDIPVVSVGKTMSEGWSLSSFLPNC